MTKQQLQTDLRRCEERLEDSQREIEHLKARLAMAFSTESALTEQLQRAHKSMAATPFLTSNLQNVVERLEKLAHPMIKATTELEHSGALRELIMQLMNEAAGATHLKTKLKNAEVEIAAIRGAAQ